MQVRGRGPRVGPERRIAVAHDLVAGRIRHHNVPVPPAPPVGEAPREGELEVAALPRGEGVHDAEGAGADAGQLGEHLLLGQRRSVGVGVELGEQPPRAVLQGQPRFGGEQPVVGEVVPEQPCAVGPVTGHPLRLHRGGGIRRGQAQRAVPGVVCGEVDAEVEAAHSALLAPAHGLRRAHAPGRIGTGRAAAGGVRDAAHHGHGDGREAGVAHAVAEDRGGDAGGVGVEGNERGEGVQGDVDRQRRVFEVDVDHRVLAVQRGRVQAGKAREPVEGVTGVGVVASCEPRLQHTGDRRAALGCRVDREEGVGVVAPLVRKVLELPVAQLSAGADRDVARADASEGEGRGL